MTTVPSLCVVVRRVQDRGKELPQLFGMKVDKWQRPKLGDIKAGDRSVVGESGDTVLLT